MRTAFCRGLFVLAVALLGARGGRCVPPTGDTAPSAAPSLTIPKMPAPTIDGNFDWEDASDTTTFQNRYFETGAKLPLENGSAVLEIPKHDFRIVEFRSSEK